MQLMRTPVRGKQVIEPAIIACLSILLSAPPAVMVTKWLEKVNRRAAAVERWYQYVKGCEQQPDQSK
jgi:hypothetical protein